jgi:hypothetical protein
MSSYEYHQILQFLYFEGYADSYEEAEELVESLNDDEFEELNEARRKLAHSFPLKPSERRSAENIERMNRGDFSVPPEGSVRVRSSRKNEPEPEPEEKKPKGRKTDMSKVIVAHYLFDEGYAETIESAELIAESISEEWARQILDEAEKVFPLKKVADKMRKVSGKMKSSNSPEERAKLRKRLDTMGDQYWQPN